LPHLDKEEDNKRLIKIIIKITIIIKEIKHTNFIITKTLISSYKLKIIENKKIKKNLFVLDVGKLDIFKIIAKLRKKLIKYI
jgi:hypothetical protein